MLFTERHAGVECRGASGSAERPSSYAIWLRLTANVDHLSNNIRFNENPLNIRLGVVV